MFSGLIIAIDGPAGSGKSTSAKLVAQKLGYLYIDTGAMYRAVTFLALENNVIGNESEIVELARQNKIELEFTDGETKVFLNGHDVSKEIRSTEVNKHVSNVSKIKDVRSLLVEKQRIMGKSGSGVVMEGRDITTVVFPNADVKIFLTASLDERANRRTKEYADTGSQVSVDDIKSNLSNRDRIDSTRDDSPLTKADDAVVIDTTNVTISEQVDLILKEVNKAATKKGITININ
jgi:cytidylate kinase